MEAKNLLIIGGVVVLAGYYLIDKNKKAKSKANELQMLLASQAQANTVAPTPLVTSNLLTDAEAKVFATRTIAQVNSILTKYPALTKQEFLVGYNAIYKTDLFVDGNGEIAFPKIPNTVNSNPREITLLYSMAEHKVNDAKRQFNGQQIMFSHWKTDFGTVYKNLKDYYATLTKEKANRVIRFLPKMIVYSMLGDQDPRTRANNFFSEQETIDMVDSKIDFEKEIKNALGEFFENVRKFSGGNIKQAINAVAIAQGG
jgi:hypothetical protein